MSNFKINRLRPPGAVAEVDFVRLCIRCARCIAVCPYEAIKRAGFSEGLLVGTPYIFPETKPCPMCMLCTQVCPTGALDKNVTEREQMRIGVAKIDENICLNHIYARAEDAGFTDGYALYCNTCYNVCPLQNKAIYLEDLILPIITDQCTGCGICVRRCPTTPKAINIVPIGLADLSEVYDSRKRPPRRVPEGVLGGEELLREKQRLGTRETIEFEFNYEANIGVKEWEQ